MSETTVGRRRFLQLGLAAAGAVALEACNRVGERPGSRAAPPPADVTIPAPRPTIRLASQEGGFLSPYTYGPGTYSSLIFAYDTLLLKDPKEVFQPWLASGFERSVDGLTYTFRLRENARWHDGRPVTADDAVFSFEYFARHGDNLPPTVLFRPNFVERASAPAPNTLQIRLTKPAVNFTEEVAATFPIVPRHIWSGIGDPTAAEDPKLLVGSGPYRLESSDPAKETFSFAANDDFYLGRPFVKRIELRPVDDELIALRGGDIDAGAPQVGAPTRAALAPFRGDPAFGVEAGDPDFFAAVVWNLGMPGPTSDIAFRRACAMAINRPSYVRRLLGAGLPGNPGFLPRTHPFYSAEGVRQYEFDLRQANRLLDEAGYRRQRGERVRIGPDGKPLEINLLTFPELAPTAEVLRESLRQIGVRLVFKPTDFFRAIVGGELKNFEMALQFFGGLDRDPDFFRTYLASQTAGTGIFHTLNWKNPEFDDLAERQLVVQDEAERRGMFARMQQILAHDLPLLALYYATPFWVYKRSVLDQWSGDAESKYYVVTGRDSGGLDIRPIKD